MLNIRESRLAQIDGFLSNRILIDMLAPEPSMTSTVWRGGHEILQGEGKREGGHQPFREKATHTYSSFKVMFLSLNLILKGENFS